MEYGIKFMLLSSPSMKLQWKEIFNTLYPKFKEHKTKNSFSVTLHRKLKRLISVGDLEKEEKGHQRVFYFIPKKRQEKVIEEIEKAAVLEKFDAFLDSFSSKQRKKLLQNSVVQQQLFVSFLGRFSIEFLSSIQQLLEPWVSKLEKPTEDIRAKYSKEERERFLIEIHDLQKESEEIKNSIIRDNQPLSDKEYRKALNLTQEFMDKVVPKYAGGWREAIMNLMSEAIEKAEIERKGDK